MRNTDEEDSKHVIQYDDIAEKILKNVPIQNQKYVKQQLELLDKNYIDYFDYWCEKYYRNGFVDSIELLITGFFVTFVRIKYKIHKQK